MGQYCCCGCKKSYSTEGCTCEWDGWVTFDKDGKLSHPPYSGKFLVRYCDNSGDYHETEMEYSKKPFRIDTGYYGTNEIPIHWKEESWDDNHVFAWKSLHYCTGSYAWNSVSDFPIPESRPVLALDSLGIMAVIFKKRDHDGFIRGYTGHSDEKRGFITDGYDDFENIKYWAEKPSLPEELAIKLEQGQDVQESS